MTHKKIMTKCGEDLEKDAKHYEKAAKKAKKPEKKKLLRNKGEARSAAQDMKSRARKAHD